MPSRRAYFARGFLCVAAVLAITACQTQAPTRPIQTKPVDFSAFSPIVMAAGSVDVVDNRRGASPVDSRLAVTPADAVRRWAADRLVAAGGPGRVRVVIHDASILETQLDKTGGVRGFFTNDQAQRYDGRIDVEVVGERPGETSFRGLTRATVTQSTTVDEKASLAGREATLNDLTRRLIDDLNARLDAGIRKDLAPMVRR